MADFTHHPPEIARLLEQAEASRARLGHGVAAVRERLDVPARMMGSLRTHPLRWVGGAAAAGLALALLVRGRPSPRAGKPKRFGGMLFTLAFAAAKPAIKAWLANQAKSRLEAFISERLQTPRQIPRPPC